MEQTTNEDLGSSALNGNDDLVRRSQKMLTAWRSSGNRSKRFRFQNVKAQRNDLSINLTRLFCDNSDYESLQLVQSGINLEKDTTIKILKVRPRPNALYLGWIPRKTLSSRIRLVLFSFIPFQIELFPVIILGEKNFSKNHKFWSKIKLENLKGLKNDLRRGPPGWHLSQKKEGVLFY